VRNGSPAAVSALGRLADANPKALTAMESRATKDVNAYIAAYDEGRENPIVEGADLVALLLSLRVDREWRGEDIFTLARFQSASLSYDPGDDTGRSELLASALEAFPAGDPRAAIYRDLFDDLPARPVYTRDGFNDGSSMALRRPGGARTRDAARTPMLVPPVETLRGAQAFFDRTEAIFQSAGFGDESRGSNNWLVAASLTANDNPIMSHDPHLSLISPGVWWYVHPNTAKMGSEDSFSAESVPSSCTFPARLHQVGWPTCPEGIAATSRVTTR